MLKQHLGEIEKNARCNHLGTKRGHLQNYSVIAVEGCHVLLNI